MMKTRNKLGKELPQPDKVSMKNSHLTVKYWMLSPYDREQDKEVCPRHVDSRLCWRFQAEKT